MPKGSGAAAGAWPLGRDCLTWELEELLRRRFELEHNTVQIEGPGFHDPRVCPLTRLEGLLGRSHR
jgi:hypothetical protein